MFKAGVVSGCFPRMETWVLSQPDPVRWQVFIGHCRSNRKAKPKSDLIMSSYLSKIWNRIPSWRDNVAQFEVYIYEGEYRQIEDWVLQKDNIETGGDLFGLWIDSHKAVVQFVLGPGTHCQRSNVSFYQDISYLSKVGNYLLKNHGLCNIGQWHSHHRIKLDKPSVGDERTVWNNLPDLNLNSYIVFIATIKDGRDGRPAVDVNCFLFELDVNGSPLPVQKGQFKKINKDSPMRLHCDILDCSSYGAEPVEQKAIGHSGNQQGNTESGSYDAHFSTSRRKNDSEKNMELLEKKNELGNTNEQPKVLKQDGEKEEGKEGLKEDEKEGEKEGKEEDEKEEEKEEKEEEMKEEEGKEEEKKEEEEGTEEGKEEKKEKEELEEGKEKEEQQEREEEVEREEEGEQQEEEEEEEEEDREEEKEEVKCKTGNISKGQDTLDNVDAIGTESRGMQLAEQKRKEMDEYGRESELKPQDTKETITLLQKSTNCNTNVNFEDGKGTKNERKDNKTMKESDGDKSKGNGEGKPDAGSTDENISTENGDKQRKTATKEDNPEETPTGSKDDSHAKYKVMNQKEDEIDDTHL